MRLREKRPEGEEGFNKRPRSVLKKGSKKRHAATGRFVLLGQGASKRRDMKLSRDLQSMLRTAEDAGRESS
jgi:hypothetical protein